MRVALILGQNFEEVEAITPIDILRRAQVEVITYGVGGKEITGSHQITVQADRVFMRMDDIHTEEFDALLLPGGPGVNQLVQNQHLLEVIRRFVAASRWVYAVCAAPLLLDRAGVLEGRNFTCYPGTVASITSGKHKNEPVVVDGNIITSQGVGTSLLASLKLVSLWVSDEEARQLAERVVFYGWKD
ncbi:DJ-1 family glyoxalase III [Thermospira aquatica]|uniref:DJ-1/PfpI family protein n=1 Tax=Thermospira aquatica TaxID=2828656 RepID=A0AAX3BCP5_9SPIR|nr:DJ-1 family glyoxalase III [Thermospira aquatica]URA09789.1 DJ-1/PfpI family protein [Thermospira aquatica]